MHLHLLNCCTYEDDFLFFMIIFFFIFLFSEARKYLLNFLKYFHRLFCIQMCKKLLSEPKTKIYYRVLFSITNIIIIIVIEYLLKYITSYSFSGTNRSCNFLLCQLKVN